jgi:hypothetical protein
MKYIPTVTSNFDKVDLSQYDEILLTPNKRTPTILPPFKGSIIIDNGCYLINKKMRDKKFIFNHIEICKEIKEENNCIFVIPDILHDYDFSLKAIELFFKEISPKNFIIPFMKDVHIEYMENIYGVASFYAIPASSHKYIKENKNKFHLFGNIFTDTSIEFRSYDSTIHPNLNLSSPLE